MVILEVKMSISLDFEVLQLPGRFNRVDQSSSDLDSLSRRLRKHEKGDDVEYDTILH